LPLVNQQIVSQSKLAQHSKTALKIRAKHVFISLTLQHMPHSPQLRLGRKSLQHSRYSIVRQRNPAHHSSHKRIFGSYLQQPLCLFKRLARLHRNRPIHSGSPQLSLQFSYQIVAPQHTHRLVDPAILLGGVVPEMVMRIDDSVPHLLRLSHEAASALTPP
jgi:hypothetical protein